MKIDAKKPIYIAKKKEGFCSLKDIYYNVDLTYDGEEKMVVSKETLKGYILEEVLAYLIRSAGYRLLTDPSQDPRELDWRHNGLVIKGRGAYHQVDVLGELQWIPAFTFPLRLIIEAKFRKDPTYIDLVRSSVGIIHDVNQNIFPLLEGEEIYPKYQYVYAIFSTSGFSRNAVKMAIAYKISLIDLSGSDYDQLKDAIETDAAHILMNVDIEDKEKIKRDDFIFSLRYFLRKKLETLPKQEGEKEPNKELIKIFDEQLSKNVISTARDYNTLFVGMANGPFMLLLKADNPTSFLQYSIQNPSHRITIHWSSQVEKGELWTIRPVENPDAYELTFKLPKILSKWIRAVENKITQSRAIKVKQKYFSNITIYHKDGETDYMFRLMFDLERTLVRNN